VLHSGELVARVAAPELAARLARARAELAEVRAAAAGAESRWQAEKARAEAARAEGEMVERLYAKGAATERERIRARSASTVARAEAEAARAALEAARAAVMTARSRVREAEVQVAFQELRCPYPEAVVLRRLASLGAAVRAEETPVAELAVVSRLRVRAALPEKAAVHLRRGQAFTLRLDALPGRSWELQVVHQRASLEAGSKALWVEGLLDNRGRHLLPGLYGQASFVLESRLDALVLPGGLILTGADGEPHVFVIEDGVARRRVVRLGLDDGVRVEVLEGLAPGEAVASGGRERLRDGAPVRVNGEEGRR